MEPIKNPFIYFKTRSAFDNALREGRITEESKCIVFIGDSQLIWTHGTFFGDGTTDKPQPEDNAGKEYVDGQIEGVKDTIDGLSTTVGKLSKNIKDLSNSVNDKLSPDDLKTVNTKSLIKDGSTNISIETIVDPTLSTKSKNPVQNKAVAEKIDLLQRSIESKTEDLKAQIDGFKNTHEHNKGLFASYDELKTFVTNPVVGDWGIVIDGNTQYIYKYGADGWPNDPDGTYTLAESYDLSIYSKISDLDELKKALADLSKSIPTDISDLNNVDNHINNLIDQQFTNNYSGLFVKKREVYTPNQATVATEGEIDAPGKDPYRAKAISAKPNTGNYITYAEMSEILKSVVTEDTIIIPSDYTEKRRIVTESQYNELTEYEDDIIYFVIEDTEDEPNTNWTFGGTFPITLTSEGLGTFPINLT